MGRGGGAGKRWLFCFYLAIRNRGWASGDQEEVWAWRNWQIVLPGDHRRGNMPVGIRKRCGDGGDSGLLNVATWVSEVGK